MAVRRSHSSRTATRRIAVAVAPVDNTLGKIVAGIHQHRWACGPVELIPFYRGWSLNIEALATFAGDGVIARVGDPRLREALDGLNLPSVGVLRHRSQFDPGVSPDHQAIGALAADFFLRRGFVRFGCFFAADILEGPARLQGFADRLGEHGKMTQAFTQGLRVLAADRWRQEDQIADCADWLSSQAYPFAVFCINDEHADRAMRACRLADLCVPDQVAIIGAGDDPFLTRFNQQQLTSVDIDPERIGVEAAAMLDRLLGGERVQSLSVPPRAVVPRASTDVFAADDPETARAVAYIREHLDESISVGDVAEHVGVSRRTLHQRFVTAFGRGPGHVIARLRIDDVCHYLTHTDQPLAEIALEAGFQQVSQLCRDFKRHMGLTPTEFRRIVNR